MVGKSNISPSIYSQMSHIDASELKFDKMIGRGSFGQVWKGNWRKLIVAIKQVKQHAIDEKGKFSNLFQDFVLLIFQLLPSKLNLQSKLIQKE